jgi:TolB-like protein/Tfp pilus assembly protein PilF
MGINTGPISGTTDVNNQSNIAGAGINIAQRIMGLGDAGHILLSKRLADDLLQYRHWQSYLHDLGEFEVKHGAKISVVNLCTQELGNAKLPQKLKQRFGRRQVTGTRHSLLIVTLGIAVAALFLALVFSRYSALEKDRLAEPSIPRKSIAVLPFENLSDDKQNSYFTDGVQDEILMDLAKIKDLKVISRTSVMQYKNAGHRDVKEIAKQLGVAHVLEGSVQRATNRIRVTAQLIDARTDSHVWANHYDREVADIFAIQTEIAKAIADQLRAKLSPDERASIEQAPTMDLTAFGLYSRARTLMLSSSFSARTKENLLQAVDLLDEAVARDPKFFSAYCQLVFAHDILYLTNLDHTPARRSAADSALQAALRLKPDAGQAHLVSAEHFYRGYLDYERARAEIALAQRKLPNDPLAFELLGYIDRRQGRWEESTRNFEREIEVDPRNLYILQQISLTYQYQRRYPEMTSVLQRALTIAPEDVDTRVMLAQVALDGRADSMVLHSTIDKVLGENSSAASSLADAWSHLALCERDFSALEKALTAFPDFTYRIDAVVLNRDLINGVAARARGDLVAARSAFAAAREQQVRAVQSQPDYAPALCVLGLIDAGLGRKEEALKEGRHAVELLSTRRDAINGSHMISVLAIIYAWTGEKDLALQQLAIATQNPGWLNYGQLRLHPFWDQLRDDSRFDKIVAALAPRNSN